VKSADQAVGSTPCTPLHVPPTWRVH
jgi:hypothetical protein